MELLAAHLSNLLSSEYHRRPSSDATLERQLRALQDDTSKKGFSFGHYGAALDRFPNALRDGYSIPELAHVVRQPLPDGVATAVRAIEVLVEARKKFEIPVHLLQAFVESRTAGQSLGKKLIQGLLPSLTEIRNASSHPSPGPSSSRTGNDEGEASTAKAWWVEDTAFYRVLNGYLVPLLKDLLLWEPLDRLLTRIIHDNDIVAVTI